jgi:PAS domain S-box-containing protein
MEDGMQTATDLHADPLDHVDPATSDHHADPLDPLLERVVDGFFVLADGHGAISKWGEPAELLFGLDADEALGHSLFDRLLDEAHGDAAAWRQFLQTGEPPEARGRVAVRGRHAASGHTFGLELVFVPVKLDEGFDFSLFLEDLGSDLPANLMLPRLRRQHPVVTRALGAALEDHPQRWEGWRTAGTFVALRPTEPTPWVEEELRAREEQRAREAALAEASLTDPDPGIQGESVSELEDAAAVVARLLSAMERIDALERGAGALPDALERARREAEAARAEAAEAREQAAAAEHRVEELRGELDDARAALDELRGGLASAGAVADQARHEAEQARRAAEAEREQAGVRVNEVFHQILEVAMRGGAAETPRRPAAAAPAPAERPARDPRPGFDDAAEPLAVLGLDGRFRELNPAFAKLVGYGEEEFGKAVWPSVHDRRVFESQKEQLERLAAGEVDAIRVESTYMHGQGLMVPVAGELRLTRDQEGRPTALLLAAENHGHA